MARINRWKKIDAEKENCLLLQIEKMTFKKKQESRSKNKE